METKKEDVLGKTAQTFDADLLPSNERNRETAVALGLRYDQRRCVYVDEDGLPTRDRFGQQL